MAANTSFFADHYIRHSESSYPTAFRDKLMSIATNSNPGDFVRYEDGQIIGRYWEQLGAFINDEHEIPYNEWVVIMRDTPPSFRAVQPRQSSIEAIRPHLRGYSRRACIQSNGKIIHQVLVIAFGEPAWINVHPETIYEDYDSACPAHQL